MAKKNDLKRVKISAGGPWDGALWYPNGIATERTRSAAEEYGNEVLESESIAGELHQAKAFGNKDVFYVDDDEGRRVMLPEHGGLTRDLELMFVKHGDGARVEIEYKGMAKIKSGKWKNKSCHTYDVFFIRS
jgi:hypothetical protein